MLIWVTLLGFQMCFSRYSYWSRVYPGRQCSAVSNDAAWAISETSMCSRALLGYLRWVNVTLPPLGGGDSKWKGTLSHCCWSPTSVWVALGTAVVDLLCVEPGPIVLTLQFFMCFTNYFAVFRTGCLHSYCLRQTHTFRNRLLRCLMPALCLKTQH